MGNLYKLWKQLFISIGKTDHVDVWGCDPEERWVRGLASSLSQCTPEGVDDVGIFAPANILQGEIAAMPPGIPC